MDEIEDPIEMTTANRGTDRHRKKFNGHSVRRPVDYRVLVIGDDDAICDSAAAILTAVGYRVSKAVDGITAMSRLATESFKLVVTDLEMALLNGYRLCTWLKKESPETIAIIMTGKDQFDVANLMATGLVDQWIFKPFGVHELYGALDSLGLPVYPQR